MFFSPPSSPAEKVIKGEALRTYTVMAVYIREKIISPPLTTKLKERSLPSLCKGDAELPDSLDSSQTCENSDIYANSNLLAKTSFPGSRATSGGKLKSTKSANWKLVNPATFHAHSQPISTETETEEHDIYEYRLRLSQPATNSSRRNHVWWRQPTMNPFSNATVHSQPGARRPMPIRIDFCNFLLE